MVTRRAFARIAVLALFLAATAVANPWSATSALAKCDPGRTDDGRNYWDGWARTPGGTVGGVGSDILNYSPWVHATDDSVSAWTMTANGSLYAQVGWIEYPLSFRYTFTEYTTSDGNWHRKTFGTEEAAAACL